MKWDRRSGESTKAYRAFCAYRNLGTDRSLDRALDVVLADGHKGVLSTFKRWSAKNDWVDRAAAWDVEVDRKARRQLEKDRVAAQKRHMEAGRALFNQGVLGLDKKEPVELTPKDVVTFIVEGIRIERQALGEPSEVVEHDVHHTVSRKRKAAKARKFLQRHVGVRVSDAFDESD